MIACLVNDKVLADMNTVILKGNVISRQRTDLTDTASGRKHHTEHDLIHIMLLVSVQSIEKSVDVIFRESLNFLLVTLGRSCCTCIIARNQVLLECHSKHRMYEQVVLIDRRL